ncbi:3-oxoacyl-[acyl-carrier-protein] synthase, KASIII (EC [uncultured Gammaproteobacteria bacterium]|jgi:3-oxoacyl-[acyl-carrier-protein] synthase-3|nr:3-oxoacyl-[acyl-carrier-protein] synthase, KASIII (EC [uncultured Gammaproteobacteria bacterium]VVM27238.1 3-oxoacyl-[acyl-carrier-protein] synthase, KASIII (EC [uncultured Gammaproteobacteria bacterium]
MKIKINLSAYYLPEKKEDNRDLKRDNPDWDMSKISEKTGVFIRSIALSHQTAVDLAFEAGSKLLKDLSYKADIDLIILVTQSPDYVLPTSACILQDRLGLSKECMAFDINLGCSGFIYALSVAGSLIESGVAKKSLVLCSDTYTKYIRKNDRTCRTLFSDGASATLLTASDSDDIGPFIFGTDGSGYDKLIVRESGARKLSENVDSHYGFLEMSGADVFLFTLSTVPVCVNNLLNKSKLNIEDIDLFVFHQASKLVIENLIRAMSLDKDKVFINLKNIGNTVSASIPIALEDANIQGRLKNGDKIMLVGFGVGLSWGATLITWSES